jgi:hypothetical protein
VSAHPDDILVVMWTEEARLHPQFLNRQVIPVSRPEKLRGLKFRRAYITDQANIAVNARFWGIFYGEVHFQEAEILSIDEYRDGE